MIAAVIEGVQPLLANSRSRGAWYEHKADEDHIVALARADALQRRNRQPTSTGPVVVTLVACPPAYDARGRRRAPTSYPDLDGYQPTLKRMLDGVVRARVLTDDNPTVVSEIRTRQGPAGTRWRLELHITPDIWEALT